MPAPQAFVIAAKRLLVDPELPLAQGHEALAGVVVVAGSEIEVAGGRIPVFLRRGVGELLDPRRLAAPFLRPSLRILRSPRSQPLADALDLLERHGAVGRHALAHERRIRPLEIARKRIRPGVAARHPAPPSRNSGCYMRFARMRKRRARPSFTAIAPPRRA